MTLAGGPDAPPVNNSGMADQMGAVWLAFGAIAALLARERHGFGQEVFSSGLGAMINLQSIAVLSRTATGQGPGYQDRADARESPRQLVPLQGRALDRPRPRPR